MPYSHLKRLGTTCLSRFTLKAAPVPFFAALVLVAGPLAGASWAQTANSAAGNSAKLPPVSKQPNSPKANAYYHFALGHMYEEMAANAGNRSEYVNKAIDNFRLAMKEDPDASFLVEDIAELYRMSGRIRDAVEEAQEALKMNPDDLNARRVLARIYTQQIGDAQANHVDENMARKAIEQYKLITQKDPKDADSLVMLGRLDRVLDDSVGAEAAFKQASAAEPDNEDAIVGLASVYSDRGDTKAASDLLEKLTQKSPSPRALVALATDYESMHEYSLAADAYKKAIDLDPNRGDLRASLAQDQALAGRYDDALQTYHDLAEATPQDPQPYLGMAQIYREQKKTADARKALDKAKSLDPDNIEIRFNEVGLLADEGRNADAITELKNLLDSTARASYDPPQKSARAQMLDQLGRLYSVNEQYTEAVNTFRQIAALDPDQGARAEAEVVDTLRIAKEYTKAQEASDAAAKKYPTDRTLAEVRAQLLSDQGKTDQAIATLRGLLHGNNDRQVYLGMADVYQKAKNYPEMEQAINSADRLSKTQEEKTNIVFLRGEMLERQKKYEDAEKLFRQVIAEDPKNASALNYLGYMLADQNVRLAEAQDLIKRAVALEPNNYAFLDSLGWVYFRMNKLEDAEQQLTRSLQMMSKDPTIHDHLADVYFKQGKTKEAIAQWQSSLHEWNTNAAADMEPDEVAKVQKKLDSARVKLAKEQRPSSAN